jgi:hypothetical protein
MSHNCFSLGEFAVSVLVRSFLILFHYRSCLCASFLYLVFLLLGRSETMSFGTAKFSGPSAHLSIGKMGTDRGNELFGEKPAPLPFFPHKSHEGCHERAPGSSLLAKVESDLLLISCLPAVPTRGCVMGL